jgi:hypothetical protein
LHKTSGIIYPNIYGCGSNKKTETTTTTFVDSGSNNDDYDFDKKLKLVTTGLQPYHTALLKR